MERRSRCDFLRSLSRASAALIVFACAGAAQAEFGAIAVADGDEVSWGGAVAPTRDEARAAAREACEARFEGVVCDRVRVVPPERCFAIAVDQPLRRTVGYADDTNLRFAKVKAQHACRRSGGLGCVLSHTECVPPRAASE